MSDADLSNNERNNQDSFDTGIDEVFPISFARWLRKDDSYDEGSSSKEVCTCLTKVVMKLLNEWDLKTAEQLTLLGLRETSRIMLSRYRNLETILPKDHDKPG